MKFSEAWLREWVNPDLETAQLAEQLTMAGLEVDSIEPAAGEFSGVVVAEVLSVEAHPDADKLRVCQVSTGEGEPLQIVCGAPNVRAAMKAPLATIGGRIGDMKIKKAKLRGVPSFGMLCSARELGLSEDHEGLMDLPVDAPVGQDIRDYLSLDDTLIEIDLTPNRGDCLGMEGVAREVGALTKTDVTTPDMTPVKTAIEDALDVSVRAPEACPRYLGRVIRGIDPDAQTPLWMKEKLRRGGLRSLGPVVDVTNYVLLELGQPMHAFDLAQLSGGIEVRYPKAGETLTLLDEREIEPASDTLLICDQDKPLALAGIMGGEHSGISANTHDLFLEVAFFTPEKIAGHARRYGLATDSAFRFERGVDAGLQSRAMERATALLLELVGGEAGPVSETVSEAHLPQKTPVTLRRDRIRRLLGFVPDDAEVENILARLGIAVESVDSGWLAIPPGFRFDLAIEADLIEEVGRVFGYNNLPSANNRGDLKLRPVPETVTPLERVKAMLVDRDYSEVISYSFVDADTQSVIVPGIEAVALANPISSEMSVMRTSLWPGLAGVVKFNIARQQSRIRIFESGLKFIQQHNELKQERVIAGAVVGDRLPEQWGAKPEPSDFFDVKADLQCLLDYAGVEARFEAGEQPALHPGQSAAIYVEERRVGWLGRVHPQVAQKLEIPGKTFLFELELDVVLKGRVPSFEKLSRFPSIRRDLSVVVSAETSAGALCDTIRAEAGPLLQDLRVFDVYEGKGIESGRKSIAFGLILQDSSRTLTDNDVDAVITVITGQLEQKFGAILRE
ncbi:phenylalanyl-tRNA synthetase beta subunit [Thiogranum longum]|uniref:Phenylalanine--tRNA ligase beta subunit n=1 Tax=Thiogranum longum TaxID=1537524 RepID=A0A4R1H8F7_9GAMM|nr:phenylalanine--tRNA ligase subunit beta [Thiogranum longum]TCK18124.1 phenylalanyl-tRNA synthetase beta subunit [Thiogranum longum]